MKLFLLFTLFSLSYGINFYGIDFTRIGLGGVLTESILIKKAAFWDLISLIPRPVEVTEFFKQIIATPVLESFSSRLCESLLKNNLIRLNPEDVPKPNTIYFQLRSPCQTVTYPMSEAEKLWKHPAFDPKKKLVIFTPGWLTNVNKEVPEIKEMAGAFHCRGDVNFVVVDCNKYLRLPLFLSATNTDKVADFLSDGLVKLNGTIPEKNIHLFGASYGAHISGMAARYYKRKTSKTIGRVTGLDPANPCFNVGQKLKPVNRGDAEFVDILHFNPGGYGEKFSSGNVDFYIPGDITPIPGCLTNVCSHVSTVTLYKESIYPKNKYDYVAYRCSSKEDLRDGKCKGNPVPMGYAMPTDVTEGDYYLDVNKHEPYGTNASSDYQNVNSECTKCKQ